MILEIFKSLPAAELAELLADFQAIATRHSYPKNTLLHQEGTRCDHVFILEKGVARTFYYKDGKDVTAHIATEGESITAIDSLIQRKKSRYNVEVVEDSVVMLIAYPEMQQVLEQKPQHEKYIRFFLEQIYMDLADRIENLLFYTAKERYERLVEDKPDLLQRINLSHIASYLGISQETLSRIRASKE
ncbi:MAG TPA: cyclic nucleotide-binding protein [Cytophagales bacterium]|nr:cyclic nucleotide-binding protein [Cytophagales bacterium]HAP61218.1 cyclic nucleotide-binding protein [Cytophagales bacterium]